MGLLGGQSWVTNEAQLFNVLAHEVGHLDLRHVALVIEQMEQFGFRFDDPD
jgi:predicted Zn-dependent protease